MVKLIVTVIVYLAMFVAAWFLYASQNVVVSVIGGILFFLVLPFVAAAQFLGRWFQ